MAHNADSIPWGVLAANLIYYSQDHPLKVPSANLYLRGRPEQQTEIENLTESISKKIQEDTLHERLKYPDQYEPPTADETFLNDTITHKISPIVYRWRVEEDRKSETFWPRVKPDGELCQHHDDGDDKRKSNTHINGFGGGRKEEDDFWANCECPIPFKERKTAAFLRKYRSNDCYSFHEINGAAFFNMEIVKILILCDEMDLVLRICSHPNVNYKSWYQVQQCQCMDGVLGWDRMYKLALRAYITLNVFYCFPELRRPPARNNPFRVRTGTGRDTVTEAATAGYRDTRAYQKMLHDCTKAADHSEVPAYAHRHFFGIRDNHFRHIFVINRGLELPAIARVVEERRRQYLSALGRESNLATSKPIIDDNKFPYGQVPFEILLNCETEAPYLPDASQVHQANDLLRKKLPEELVRQVTTAAGYDGPQRQLVIPHDPLHPDNREELGKYLTVCWEIIVRCNMFAQALRAEKICWKSEVMWSLQELFSGPKGERLGVEWDTD